MAVITIQCRLQAKEENLRYLWNLMIEQNTLLVSEILERIRTDPELDIWIAKGYIPVTAIDKIAKQLKQHPKYAQMPGRFGTSAETLVKDINKSWFAVQQKKRRKIWGKKRWLTIIKSEPELLKATKLNLSELQAEAEKILNREKQQYNKLKQNKSLQIEVPKDLFAHLLKIYDKVSNSYEKEKKPHLKTKKLIQKYSIVYLLKNKLEFANQPEDPDKYWQYRRKKEIQIEQLEKRLKARFPKGRQLTQDEYLEALKQAECLITQNSEDSEKPWLTNNLYLHCSVETELWTQSGTEQIRQQKIVNTKQKIDKWLKAESLSKNQQQKLSANQTSLSLLNTFGDFNRPSKHRHQQNPALAMGVCIGLKEPVTVVIVNLVNAEIIACRDTKQLLNKPIQQKPKQGKKAKKHTQYELFFRRRQQQKENDAKRQQAQTKFADNRFGESELVAYHNDFDRLDKDLRESIH